VPTLHVLFVRDDPPNILGAPKDPIELNVREELLDWIADEALGGDRDAAEWVLLACVARVYVPQAMTFLVAAAVVHIIPLSPLANHARVRSTHHH
jgi:hypothetical protein